MGKTDPVVEVEDKLPGLRFTVKESSRSARYGTVLLHCTIDDVALWELCLKKLDGLKLFSTMEQEVMDALVEELTTQASEVAVRDEKIKRLKEQLACADAENHRISYILASVGFDLGLP